MQDITHILADLTAIDGQPMTDSLKVAARFGKEHSKVLRSVRAIKADQPDFYSRHFNERRVEFTNGKGGRPSRPIFFMTEDGAAFLAARMKQPWGSKFSDSPPAKRPEFVFGEEIVERLFSGYTIIRQFPVFGGGYRIDWYIPELRLAVEFDEAHHETPSSAKRDATRQAEIETVLNCRFLRYRASRQHSTLTKLPELP